MLCRKPQQIQHPPAVFRRLRGGAAGQSRGEVALPRGELWSRRVPQYLHHRVEKPTVPEGGFIDDFPAGAAQVPPKAGGFALALEDQSVGAAPKPGGGFQNGNHGVRSHTRAEEHVKIPGQPLNSVTQEKVDFFGHTEVGSVPPGTAQRPLPDIGGVDVPGDTGLEQMEAQIAVVTAYVRHPLAGSDEGGAGQKPGR